MTDADGNRKCDFGFLNLLNEECLSAAVGDSHAGYIGFRDPENSSSLVDDGAMDLVVGNWTEGP